MSDSESKIITSSTAPEAKAPQQKHMRKFMGGRMTASEVHRAVGIRKKCSVCGQPAAIRIKVFASLTEMTQRNPNFIAAIMAANPDGPFVPTIDTKWGKMMKLSDVGACDNCKVEAEKASAKHPDWCFVEIDRGIKDVIQTGYGS